MRGGGNAVKCEALLIYSPGTESEEIYPFTDQIVVGRHRPASDRRPGMITIPDPMISGRHCILTRSADDRFFVRDVSRNGTRLAGRRLIPNVEAEMQPGDSLQIGDHLFILQISPGDAATDRTGDSDDQTHIVASKVDVTILVGDIRSYTALTQQFSAAEIFPSMHRIFARLEEIVVDFEGTVKEYQGDAIFAFWESVPQRPGWHACQACRAALSLRDSLRQLARDPAAWTLRDFPLRMEWALTTGPVLLSSLGGERPTGLAMIGDAVNYAFRLEKLASDENGELLACKQTYALAHRAFEFREIGELSVEGRPQPQMIYALEGPSG
jgi:class 3 adenylate cyclase